MSTSEVVAVCGLVVAVGTILIRIGRMTRELSDLSTRIAEVKGDLTARVAEVKDELSGRTAQVKDDLSTRIAEVKANVGNVEKARDRIGAQLHRVKTAVAVLNDRSGPRRSVTVAEMIAAPSRDMDDSGESKIDE